MLSFWEGGITPASIFGEFFWKSRGRNGGKVTTFNLHFGRHSQCSGRKWCAHISDQNYNLCNFDSCLASSGMHLMWKPSTWWEFPWEIPLGGKFHLVGDSLRNGGSLPQPSQSVLICFCTFCICKAIVSGKGPLVGKIILEKVKR